MKILAIDLGETTGYAFIGGLGGLLHGTTPLGFIPLNPAPESPDLIVIERPAYIGAGYKVQEQYSDAIVAYRRLFGAEKVKVVRPADWMPRFHSYPLPGRGVLPTQHEKDAFRMAAWALDKFGS